MDLKFQFDFPPGDITGLHEELAAGPSAVTRLWWDVQALLADPGEHAASLDVPHLAPVFELAQQCLRMLLEDRPYSGAPSVFTIAHLASPEALQMVLREMVEFGMLANGHSADLADRKSAARTYVKFEHWFAEDCFGDAGSSWWPARDGADRFASMALVMIDFIVQMGWDGIGVEALRMVTLAAIHIGQARQMIFTVAGIQGGIPGLAAKMKQQAKNLPAAAAGKTRKAERERLLSQPLAREILKKAQGRKSQDELMRELAEALHARYLLEKGTGKPSIEHWGKEFTRSVFKSLGVPWGARKPRVSRDGSLDDGLD
jgi:hypothetical protein